MAGTKDNKLWKEQVLAGEGLVRHTGGQQQKAISIGLHPGAASPWIN